MFMLFDKWSLLQPTPSHQPKRSEKPSPLIPVFPCRMFNNSQVRITGGTFTFVQGSRRQTHTHKVTAVAHNVCNVAGTQVNTYKNCHPQFVNIPGKNPFGLSVDHILIPNADVDSTSSDDDNSTSDSDGVTSIIDYDDDVNWTDDEAEEGRVPQKGHKCDLPREKINPSRTNMRHGIHILPFTKHAVHSTPQPGVQKYTLSHHNVMMEAEFNQGDISPMGAATSQVFDMFMKEVFENDTRSDAQIARDVATEMAHVHTNAGISVSAATPPSGMTGTTGRRARHKASNR